MAWDFAGDEDFEPQLEWMRTFVREEVEPLETLDLEPDQLRRLSVPM